MIHLDKAGWLFLLWLADLSSCNSLCENEKCTSWYLYSLFLSLIVTQRSSIFWAELCSVQTSRCVMPLHRHKSGSLIALFLTLIALHKAEPRALISVSMSIHAYMPIHVYAERRSDISSCWNGYYVFLLPYRSPSRSRWAQSARRLLQSACYLLVMWSRIFERTPQYSRREPILSTWTEEQQWGNAYLYLSLSSWLPLCVPPSIPLRAPALLSASLPLQQTWVTLWNHIVGYNDLLRRHGWLFLAYAHVSLVTIKP